MRPDRASETLRATIRELGMKAGFSTDPDGFDVASVAYLLPDGSRIALSATVRVEELQFLIQDAIPTVSSDERLEWAFKVNDEWGFGRLYLGEGAWHFDATAAWYLGAGPHSPAARGVLHELVEGVMWLRGGRVPRYVPPATAPEITVAQITSLLDQLGVPHAPSPSGGFSLGIVHEGVAISIQLYVLDRGLLNLRARLHPRFEVRSHSEGLRAANALNARLSCGSVSLQDGRWPSYHLPISSEWCVIDESLLRWAVSKVLYVTLHARRTLPLVELA